MRIMTGVGGPVLVAIGANLPDSAGRLPLASVRGAVEALRSIAGLRLAGCSRWYASVPMPVSDQPVYINGAVRLEGRVDPGWMLARLHAIEAAAGRVRGAVNAARVLDLDLIAVGDVVCEGAVVLPHPRAHLRPFVLQPVVDVAPEWVHPRLRQTAGALLAGLPAAAGGAILQVVANA